MLDLADEAWKAGTALLEYCPFKHALFVLGDREMVQVAKGGVAPEALISRVEQRALDKQPMGRQVRVGQDGKALPLPKFNCGTGETTSMVMLALLAAPIDAHAH